MRDEEDSETIDMFGNRSKGIAYDEWVGMPEFEQNKQEPYKQLIIRFENKEDYERFSKVIDQKLTIKTKSIWFPFKSHWREGKQPIWYSREPEV